MLRKLLLLVIVVLPTLSGCGGSGTVNSLRGPIIGTWSGSYSSSTGSVNGTLVLTVSSGFLVSGVINPGCSTTISSGQLTASSSTGANVTLDYDISCSSLAAYSSDESQYATLTGTFSSDNSVFSGTMTEYHVRNEIGLGTTDIQSFTGTFSLTLE